MNYTDILAQLSSIKSIDDFYKFKKQSLLSKTMDTMLVCEDSDCEKLLSQWFRIINLISIYNYKNEILEIYKKITNYLYEKNRINLYVPIAISYVIYLQNIKLYRDAERILNKLFEIDEEAITRQQWLDIFYQKLILRINYIKSEFQHLEGTTLIKYKSNWLGLNCRYDVLDISIFEQHVDNLKVKDDVKLQLLRSFRKTLILIKIQDFEKSWKHINNIKKNFTLNKIDNEELIVLTTILEIEIAMQENDYFIVFTKLNSVADYFEKNKYIYDLCSILITWGYQFYEEMDSEKALSALLKFKEFCNKQHMINYAKLIFNLFKIYIQEQSEEYAYYLNILLKIPEKYLSLKELHFIHLIAAEDYSRNINTFEESMLNFKKSNQLLMKTWNSLLSEISIFNKEFPDEDSDFISKAIDFKLKEVLLDSNLHINHFLQSLQSVFDNLRGMYNKVQNLSLTDELTGLNNRRYLISNANELLFLAKRQGSPISVAMMDLDDFKNINDTYGHHIGDKVLAKFGQILKSSFRQSDIVVRYGGEEFLAILFNTEIDNAKIVMENIRKKLEKEVFYTDDEKQINVTVSVGVTTSYIYNDNAENILEELIKQADDALYISKGNGKNCVTIYL